MKAALALTFIACILLANIMTSAYGMVSVGFGLTATAGTYMAGVTFLVRDGLQEVARKWEVAGLIVLGALLSFLLGDGRIALASGAAFLLSEALDMAVYTPLRERGKWLAGVATSNTVGSLVDTVVFLAIAGFPIWSSVPGQMLGKLTVTAAFVALAVGSRALLRQPK